jgi:spermidine/putrescine transport system permease protein
MASVVRSGRAWWSLPPVVFIATVVLLPLALLVAFSVLRLAGGSLTATVSFRAWHEIFTDPLYIRLIGRSMWLGAMTAVLTAVLGFPVALGIWRLPVVHKGLALIVLLTPLYTGEIMRLYAWRLVLGAQGMLNSLLQWLGIIDAPLRALLFSPFATHVVLFYNTLPYMVLCLWVSLELIDGRLVEAARDLGASPRVVFTRILLPLSMPGLIGGAFIVFALAAGDLTTPNLMGGTSGSTAMAMIDNLFGTAFDWSLASAMALCLLAALVGIPLLAGLALSRLRTVRRVLGANR